MQSLGRISNGFIALDKSSASVVNRAARSVCVLIAVGAVDAHDATSVAPLLNIMYVVVCVLYIM